MITAITDFNKVIEIDPNYSPAYGFRGDCKYFLNKFESAIFDFSKAIEINPDESDRETSYRTCKKHFSTSDSTNISLKMMNEEMTKILKDKDNLVKNILVQEKSDPNLILKIINEKN